MSEYQVSRYRENGVHLFRVLRQVSSDTIGGLCNGIWEQVADGIKTREEAEEIIKRAKESEESRV